MQRDEFNTLAKQGFNRIPLVKEVLADLETPLSLYIKLTQAFGKTNTYLLYPKKTILRERHKQTPNPKQLQAADSARESHVLNESLRVARNRAQRVCRYLF